MNIKKANIVNQGVVLFYLLFIKYINFNVYSVSQYYLDMGLSANGLRDSITTGRQLYKYLLRACKCLPSGASQHYRHSIKQVNNLFECLCS